MMTYEEFKGKMINSIKEYLPAKYSEFDIFVVSIQKINQKLDGLRLKFLEQRLVPRFISMIFMMLMRRKMILNG
ncbi:hypothetical protein [Laedolimicola ammoniilytica]|uniref:Uncharacterized protein n=1 Tax=Laedolimicola ammoniilytica TaxID=2981771 RepID=A0ABT2RTH4_9FIRM|nr:hypothetical protein [Laedolimicola ammoniilytica]MCU6695614.1 hypothetical protein [Laedolimicola ammoniilytica]SCH11375.1 Uncharacterised protein [uncultured Clostridium sp.]